MDKVYSKFKVGDTVKDINLGDTFRPHTIKKIDKRTRTVYYEDGGQDGLNIVNKLYDLVEMKYLETLPTYGETKILMLNAEGNEKIYLVSSSGISVHPDEEHIQYCLKIAGTFRGFLHLNHNAISLAKAMLAAKDMPERHILELQKHIKTWEEYKKYADSL